MVVQKDEEFISRCLFSSTYASSSSSLEKQNFLTKITTYIHCYLQHRSLPGSAELSAPRPTREILTIPTPLANNLGYRLRSNLAGMRNIYMR